MRTGSLPAQAAAPSIVLPFLLLGGPAFPGTHDCVQPDACGCSLVIDGERCPRGSGVHFSHALVDGAPLRFRSAGTEHAAISRRPPGNAFSGQEGASWSETYDHAGTVVELRYEPGVPSCPKVGEACEYFDVNARIRLRGGGKTLDKFRAHGKCGC